MRRRGHSAVSTEGRPHRYRRTGKGEQARDHLATATTLYREMDMWFWAERAAEGEMKES